MLTSRSDVPDGRRRHGCKAARLAELRRALSRPSSLSEGLRQRLLDLERRLAAVQRLGGGLDRVDMSEYVRLARTDGSIND